MRLKDGSEVLIRPIERTDRALLAHAWARFSDESRYQRFLAPKPRLTPEELDYLTDVDHVDHEALGALDPATGEGVGVARYIRKPAEPEVAEAAVAVVDAWQNRGLGTVLLRRLSERAAENGVERFSALLLTRNRRMLHLFADLGELRTRRELGDGVLEIEVDFPVHRLDGLMEALRQTAAGVVAAWLDLGAATLIPPLLRRRRAAESGDE